MIPSKWVDTIKNWFERHKPGFEPRYKSRLVGCGNFEQDDGVRTDAPTSDLETHCVVAAFAACSRTTIRSPDISNAYFQAQPLDRVILMRQAALLVRVPVCGLRDSGRGFWVKVDKDAKEVGLNTSKMFPASIVPAMWLTL